MQNGANSRCFRSFRSLWLALLFFSTIAFLIFQLPLHAQDNSDNWVSYTREANKTSLVFITGKVKRKNGDEAPFAGTGFIVSSAGHVLTCNHVIPEYDPEVDTFQCSGSVGGRYEPPYPLTIVDSEKQDDLMLLILPEEKTWTSVRSMAKGQLDSEIVVLGFPIDKPLLAATGRITSTERGRWITNAALNHGMSGGPAFDKSGAIIGIAEGGYEEANSINLLIPISYARSLLQKADSPLVSPTSTEAAKATPTEITTPLPRPSSTAFSQDKVRELWNMIIYRVRHSKLVESYVPDELHATQLINAIRDNDDIKKLIKHFEDQVNDITLGKWFISVDDTFDTLEQDLESVHHAVLEYPDVITLDPWQKRALQTAEYNRVNLLGLLTQITMQLNLRNPEFPNILAKTVPQDRPTPTATVMATPTPNPTATPSPSTKVSAAYTTGSTYFDSRQYDLAISAFMPHAKIQAFRGGTVFAAPASSDDNGHFEVVVPSGGPFNLIFYLDNDRMPELQELAGIVAEHTVFVALLKVRQYQEFAARRFVPSLKTRLHCLQQELPEGSEAYRVVQEITAKNPE